MISRINLWLGICALALLALTVAGVAIPRPVPGQFGIGYGAKLQAFVSISSLQGIIYFMAVAIMLRAKALPPLWFILGAAVAFRLTALVFPPFLSNDMYRYIWDGWVQAAWINPYRYIPNDPHLAFLRDMVVFPNINRADYAHTIYPPVAEMFFYLASALTKFLILPPVFGMKLAMVCVEAAGIWAMLHLLDAAGQPRHRILIYAWNPLPVWEFSGNGHVDALAVGLIALALLAMAKGKNSLSAAALAGAVLTKFLPFVLVPSIWRRWDWKFAGIFIALIPLLYLPYIGVGWGVFGFLSGYGAQEGIDTGQGIFLLSVAAHTFPLPAIATKLYLGAVTAVLAATAIWIVFRQAGAGQGPAFVEQMNNHALLLGILLMVGISPHYPWYYAFLLIPACVTPCPAALYLATASFLLYLNPTHTKLLWPSVVYGPVLVLAVWQFLSARPGMIPARAGAKI